MKTKKSLALAALISLFSFPSFSASFDIDDPLPHVSITEGGRAVISGEELKYDTWSTGEIKKEGTVVVIAKAARAETEKMITPTFYNRLKASGATIITIINSNDAFSGSNEFIHNAILNGKIKDKNAEVILDKNGDIFLEWGLKKSSAAIILLHEGTVSYFMEGLLEHGDERNIIKLSKQ